LSRKANSFGVVEVHPAMKSRQAVARQHTERAEAYLDTSQPRSRHLRKTFVQRGWMRGSSPRMTALARSHSRGRRMPHALRDDPQTPRRRRGVTRLGALGTRTLHRLGCCEIGARTIA